MQIIGIMIFYGIVSYIQNNIILKAVKKLFNKITTKFFTIYEF